jgi:hypothetical protein
MFSTYELSTLKLKYWFKKSVDLWEKNLAVKKEELESFFFLSFFLSFFGSTRV